MTVLMLPEPLASVAMGAHTEHGKRQLTWTLPEPGQWHRCAYTMAWLDVTEHDSWSGDRLWLSATRRMPGDGGWQRVPFTDRAREAIAGEVLPVIARYGFSRLWIDTHRTKTGDSDERAREAHRDAAWLDLKVDLARMHMDGLVEFRPVHPESGSHEVKKRVVPRHRGDLSWVPVAAVAEVDGERVGWMTKAGDLIPDEGLLL